MDIKVKKTVGEVEQQTVPENVQEKLKSSKSLPFSPAAQEFLNKTVKEIGSKIIIDSIEEAKCRNEDCVSQINVQTAKEKLLWNLEKKDGYLRHLGTVGGILLGASLSGFLSMSLGDASLPFFGVLLHSICGIVGAFLVAFHIATDRNG